MFLPITGKPNSKGVILRSSPVPQRPVSGAFNTIPHTTSYKRPLKGVSVNGLSHLPWGFGRIRLWREFNLQKHHTTVHQKGHSIPFKTVLKIWPKAITLSCVGLLFPFLQPFMFVCSESKKKLPSQILTKRCLEKPFVLNKGSDNAFHFNGKSGVADTLSGTYPKRADHVSVRRYFRLISQNYSKPTAASFSRYLRLTAGSNYLKYSDKVVIFSRFLRRLFLNAGL